MSSATREGLKAAAQSLAMTMRRVAAVKTARGANAVNVSYESDEQVVVRAGKPEGVYGWDPITALMFEDDKRHPLFGDKKYWYSQGHYPITELTLREGLDAAVNDFADAAIPELLDEYGFKDE